MSGCRNDIPAIRVSTGTSAKLNRSHITPSFGFIRYDTTNHNLEVYEENGWKDIVINDKPTIDISGKLIINDVSINKTLEVNDASFHNDVEISNNLIVAHGEVSFNKLLKVPDASFNNIGSLDGKELQIVTDSSFQKNVDISGKLVVDGDVSFNAHLSAVDASFHNNVDISGNLVVDDISGVNKITFSDSSVQTTSPGVLEYISLRVPTDSNESIHYIATKSGPVAGSTNKRNLQIKQWKGDKQSMTGTFAIISGSLIERYTAPPGTTTVIYKYSCYVNSRDDRNAWAWMAHFKVEISLSNDYNGNNWGAWTEAPEYRRTWGGAGGDSEQDWVTMEVPIKIMASGATPADAEANSNIPFKVRIQGKHWDSNNYNTDVHEMPWWDPYHASNIPPTLSLIAIK